MTITGPDTTGSDRPMSRTQILRDIQGGVIGFNKDHVVLQYLTFPDVASAKTFTAQVLPHLATGEDVLEFNALYSGISARGGVPENEVEARWMNLLFTASGLAMLEAPGLEVMPEEFRATMASRANLIGDVGRNAPGTWVAPFTGGAEPHAVVMIAADTETGLGLRRTQMETIAAATGVTVVGSQRGDARPAPNTGREHFGFRDGISQPGIETLTTSSKPTSPTSASIALGDVLVGYPDADGNISGQPAPGPTPVASPYDPTPQAPPTLALPPWTQNLSFVVLRRLRQDATAFHASMAATSATVGLGPEQLSAKLVGRWPSGAPMERVAGLPAEVDPSSADPSLVCPAVLGSKKINAFDYADDPDGLAVPRAAHIRKMNPRSETLPEGDRSSRHRMVRRGIPYGPEVAPGETPYGEVVPDTQDRGLLFVSYQASIARSFEFVQGRWSNANDFPVAGDGRDSIIAQDSDQRSFTVPPHPSMSFEQWVFTTGGAYLVSPAISALVSLSGATSSGT